MPHRDHNTYTECGMERCFIDGEGMPDVECEHAILDRIYYGVKHDPAGDSERGMSRDIVGECIREYAGGECGPTEFVWSKHCDSILLLNGFGAEWQMRVRVDSRPKLPIL